MKIVFPELDNPVVKEAVKNFPDIEWLPANSLDEAAEMVANNEADSMISGIDYSSRDVLITYRNHNIKITSAFFSSCFVCERINLDGSETHFILADGGVNKLPSKEQFYTIIEDTAKTYEAFYNDTPRIAILSYSTNGSGGKNPDLEKFHYAIDLIRQNHPEWYIDGEMQLDAAVNQYVADKKFPGSKVAGRANVLIVPDLNSGNILYKSLEQFAGFTVAGPIIQGFEKPLADLSRGSTANDIILTIKVIKTLLSKGN